MQNCLQRRTLVITIIITALFVVQAFGASFVKADISEELDGPPIPPGMEPNYPIEPPEPECDNDPPLLISGIVNGPDGVVLGAVIIAKSNQSVNTTLTNEFGQYNLELGFNYSDYNGTEIEVSAYKGKLGATVAGIATWPAITLDLELSQRSLPLPEHKPVTAYGPEDPFPLPTVADTAPDPFAPPESQTTPGLPGKQAWMLSFLAIWP